MGRIIGIDLGTTYSAVAIPEERAGDGFLVAPECPGYSVILDELDGPITPSVVAEDENGGIVVGYRAKGRAGLSPEPIMFAKRWMGDKKTFQLAKQGALQPVDVSAHILRYLKALAERRLGEKVDEVVITVPAYFDMKATQTTEKAAEMAGLRVAQIAQEPVAAALMYCAGDPRDPLRILTYDLGGGTFDIAILEKRDGMISANSVLAFDGDRYLGGYNFDKELALWILDQLNAKGYDLRLDLENSSGDKEIFAKLMVYAEQAKIILSQQEGCAINQPATGITDHADKPVAIYLNVTRKQFEAMISEQIEYTIGLCRRAMTEKAIERGYPQITREEIDEIIMVGGSSYIPLVARRLEAEFGKTPRLINPQLCVALGAAIIAGTQEKLIGDCLKVAPIPAEIDLPTLTVTGRVMAGGELKVVQGCTVTLRAVDGSHKSSRGTGAEGTFVFDGVPLAPEQTREFILSVASPMGVIVASHRFSVRQTENVRGAQVEKIGNVLSKKIGIRTVDGFEAIAPAGTPLPYETIPPLQARTADTSGQIRVPIMEENTPLGEIVIKDIPQSLPIGSPVEITVTIQENFQIRAEAYVRSLARGEKVEILLPERPQKGIDELWDDYNKLQARAEDATSNASRGILFGDVRVKRLKDRLQQCQKKLAGGAPDPSEVQDCLDEIQTLVREIGAGWKPEPERATFDQLANETEVLLDKANRENPRVKEYGYDKQYATIRAEAEKAYIAQNAAAWSDAYRKLEALRDRLEKSITIGPPPPPADPVETHLSLGQALARLEQWAKDCRRHAEFEEEFKELAAELEQINPASTQAMAQMRDWYYSKFFKLHRVLNAPKGKVEEGLVKI